MSSQVELKRFGALPPPESLSDEHDQRLVRTIRHFEDDMDGLISTLMCEASDVWGRGEFTHPEDGPGRQISCGVCGGKTPTHTHDCAFDALSRARTFSEERALHYRRVLAERLTCGEGGFGPCQDHEVDKDLCPACTDWASYLHALNKDD